MPGAVPTEADRIVALAATKLLAFIEVSASGTRALEAAENVLPAKVQEWLRALVTKPDAYRDALLVALATPLVRGERVDIRERRKGDRAASDRIGRLLRDLHIKGVVGAYQNIGKNSPTLVRGNNDAFDSLLTWGALQATQAEVEAAYDYVAASVAATARSVLPRPELRPARLTFANVMRVLAGMLGEPSRGAHEQYITAAALDAAAQQEAGALRVETKALNASDRSSRSAGDIEVFQRGRLQDGVEVSANSWTEKLPQAEDSVRNYGLSRGHVVAPVSGPDVYTQLAAATERDISVVDPLALTSVFVALLDRRGREYMLLRLYELLDEKLASPELVNGFVQRLRTDGLADAPAS
jgi:hypothetical protein